MKRRAIVSVLVALFGATAGIADDIRLGEPIYGGTGCPQGTAAVVLSPDAKSVSFLFDDYIVEAGASVGRKISRKSCNFAVPVHVPAGLRVALLKVDYRGYNALPRGAYSRFSTEYFFAGQRGPRYSKVFRGEKEEEFLISPTPGVLSPWWSKCGEDVLLRSNSSLFVRTNRTRDEAFASVDTLDFASGAFIYYLLWKSC